MNTRLGQHRNKSAMESLTNLRSDISSLIEQSFGTGGGTLPKSPSSPANLGLAAGVSNSPYLRPPPRVVAGQQPALETSFAENGVTATMPSKVLTRAAMRRQVHTKDFLLCNFKFSKAFQNFLLIRSFQLNRAFAGLKNHKLVVAYFCCLLNRNFLLNRSIPYRYTTVLLFNFLFNCSKLQLHIKIQWLLWADAGGLPVNGPNIMTQCKIIAQEMNLDHNCSVTINYIDIALNRPHNHCLVPEISLRPRFGKS